MLTTAEHRRGRAGFTLVEILVAVAILGIILALIFKPLIMGVEVLSIGRSERSAQAAAQDLADRLQGDLRTAVRVYSNFGTFDLASGNGATAGAKWHTSQPERLSFTPAARDAQGRLITPVQPASTTDALGQVHEQVVTYWAMRNDVTQPYDPLHNPRRLFRAVSYYSPYTETVTAAGVQVPLSVTTPDDLYGYAVRRTGLLGGQLDSFGGVIWPLLFDQTKPLDWYVANTDQSFASVPADATGKIMRSPAPQAAGAPDGYSHASALLGITPLTDTDTDVRELQFLPFRTDSEELQPNRNYTAYRGTLGRWEPPYQRSSDGLWTMPSNGVVSATTPMPLVGMFRVAQVRDGAGPLQLSYFISVDQVAGSPTVGHVMLYRMPDTAGGDAYPVYDITDYPRRTFNNTPATAPSDSQHLSGEMGCGINWDTGQVLTSFPQQDIIVPDSTSGAGGNTAAVVALNNYDWKGSPLPTPPLYAGGSPAATAVWQSLPLTTQAGGAGNNAYVIDDNYPVTVGGSTYQTWTAFTLSAFRPERLKTNSLGIPLSPMQLNMSIVPGSVKVVVEQGYVGAGPGAAWVTLRSHNYEVVDSIAPGVPPELKPYRCYVDPQSGKLRFYDPQVAADAITDLDGFNPPLDRQTTENGQVIRTIIRVNYEYRNNLPSIAQILAGNDTNKDVAQLTYRSRQSLTLNLTLDVPADSKHGATETIVDPVNAAATPVDRPTGARRRVTLQQRLTVGAK